MDQIPLWIIRFIFFNILGLVEVKKPSSFEGILEQQDQEENPERVSPSSYNNSRSSLQSNYYHHQEELASDFNLTFIN